MRALRGDRLAGQLRLRPRRAHPQLARALKDAGILIRAFNKPGLEDAVRVTCPGDPADFDRLCSAVLRWARPSAILFDLDGVIADVSGSYRAPSPIPAPISVSASPPSRSRPSNSKATPTTTGSSRTAS
ncbi:MAG: hypothetical protein ACFHWZ_17780 [Phycisphaerales bacterium]